MKTGSASYIKEACVDSISQALKAEKKGADQLEYCSRLDLDGLTPAINDVKFLLPKLSIPIKVMIRPRAGNFIYSHEEIELMLKEIRQFINIGVDHFVTGLLDDNLQIDVAGLTILCESFDSARFCFHKAIDRTTSMQDSIETLKSFEQITEILSSGGPESAWDGRNVLKQMVDICSDHLNLIVAGNVTDQNLISLHHEIGAQYYHGRKIVGDLGI